MGVLIFFMDKICYYRAMDDTEIFKVGDKSYVNPQKEVDETNAFVDTLRNTASNEMTNIQNQTHALGSDLPSSHGGLSGSGSVWESRYQTPVTNTLVANLQATAQSDALNNAMSNYQTYLQDQYNQAYRNYAARERAKSSSSSSGSGSGSGTTTTTTGNVTTTDTSDQTSGNVNTSTIGAEGYTVITDAAGNTYIEDNSNGDKWYSGNQGSSSDNKTTTNSVDWNKYMSVI